jgi:hypothetical protein
VRCNGQGQERRDDVESSTFPGRARRLPRGWDGSKPGTVSQESPFRKATPARFLSMSVHAVFRRPAVPRPTRIATVRALKGGSYARGSSRKHQQRRGHPVAARAVNGGSAMVLHPACRRSSSDLHANVLGYAGRCVSEAVRRAADRSLDHYRGRWRLRVIAPQ